MATVDNGALEFDAVMDNDQLIDAINEAEKRIQGLADNATTSGQQMGEMFDITTENIKIQKNVISDLEKQIAALDKQIEKIAPGKAQAELQGQANELRKELDAEKQSLVQMEDQMKKTEKTTVNFRTRIRHLRDELVMMEAAGKRNTKEYEDLRMEMANLVDAVGDATQQANILAHDQAALQGVISGLTGLAGGFTAAQGAMSLFVGENENLQKIMVKVQSLMSITIGLQQVEQALNKDSAFRVKTLGDLKRWWTGVTAKATAATTAETAATAANTTATAAGAAAATAGATANTGLAYSFRLVGAAIKSIPVFGWIAAAIGAIITTVGILASKAKKAREETKKIQDEMNTAIAEGAYKQIAAIESLSAKWESLGTNMKNKKKFIDDNQKAFEDLGVSITDVNDAELLLVKNKDKFIEACVQKAKALAAQHVAEEKYKEIIKKQMEADAMPDQISQKEYSQSVTGVMVPTGRTYMIDNPEKEQAKKDIAEMEEAASKVIADQMKFSEKEKEILSEIGVSLEKTEKKGKDAADSAVSAFKTMLAKKKAMYLQYEKWLSSNDPIVRESAKTEFADLLSEGKSYIDYLKKQREQLLSIEDRSAEQNGRLADLNNEIAEATAESIAGSFEAALNDQLSKADTIIEKLEIIKQKRDELQGDGSVEDEAKADVLDSAEEDINADVAQEVNTIMKAYRMSVDYRLTAEAEYQNKMAALRHAFNQSTDENVRQELQSAMDILRKMHQAGITSFEDLESLSREAAGQLTDFENKRLQIVNYYEPLIEAARIKGDEKAAKQLAGKRDAEIIAETDAYKDLFENIQDMSIKTFEATRRALIRMVQQSFAAGQMTYDQYMQLIDKINNQTNEGYKGRGMEMIFGSGKIGGAMNFLFGEGDLESKIKSFSTIFSQPKTDMAAIGSESGDMAANAGDAAGKLGGALSAAGGAVAMVDAIIKAVYQTISAVTDTMNTIADMQESFGKDTFSLRKTSDMMAMINDTVMSGWNKLKSGDVMGAVYETIALPMKIITMANRIHDEKIERTIEKHQDAVEDLGRAYAQLSWEVQKALGTDVYKYQKDMIENIEERQKELQDMIDAEESKKDSDDDRVKDMAEDKAEMERQKQDLLDEIANDITQTNAKSFADQLGDALVEAFGKGEDAAKSFNDTVEDILRNAVLNMLKKQFLEEGLQRALENLQNYMGYWDGEDFVFDGLTDAEIDAFKKQVEGVSNSFMEAMKVYEDLFKDTEKDVENSLTGSGGIKSVSEETATKIDGQMNAIRINQIEALNVMREQLKWLAQIQYNTAKLDLIYKLLLARPTNSLRGVGL